MMEFNLKAGRRLLAIVTAVFLMGSVALADAPPHPSAGATTPVRDVVLLDQNVLLGQVVDVHGRPGAAQEVSVRQNNHLIVTSRTAEDGRFAVSGLRSGVYQISTSTAISTVRLWKPEVAPPVADSEVVVVCGATVVASPIRRASWVRVLGNPWVMGGIAVGAVAIPLALDEVDNDSDDANIPEAS